MNTFQNRISYTGDIKQLLEVVLEQYSIGNYKSHEVLEIGYEDFNLVLNTDNSKYFVKIFATYRTPEEVDRYVNIIKKAIEFGIDHPRMYRGNNGNELFKGSINNQEFSLVIFEYIPFGNLYQTGTALDKQDVKVLSSQAAMIGNMQISPLTVYDEWSVTNISKEYFTIKDRLPKDIIEIANDTYNLVVEKIDFDSLPKCFVHGDLTKSNIIKEGDRIRILDFSVSNTNPRIQELAVLYCNTIFDYNRKEWSRKMYNVMLDEYQKISKLEEIEILTLPYYIKAGFLTNIIGTIKQEGGDIDKKENDYWRKIGVEGLIFS